MLERIAIIVHQKICEILYGKSHYPTLPKENPIEKLTDFPIGYEIRRTG